MIDIQQLRSNLDAVVARLAARGYAFERDAILALETERKEVQGQTQALQAARNAQAKKIGQAKSKGENADALLAEANAINAQMGDLEQRLTAVQERVQRSCSPISFVPNTILH